MIDRHTKGRVFLFFLGLLISFAGSPGISLGATYYGYEEWGGTWHDAEKGPPGGEDDLMCWAAAASNILDWTGWGHYTRENFRDHDAMFRYFQDHWTDQGGFPEFGWNWWFDGYNPSQTWPGYSHVDVEGGKFWYPTYDFGDYYSEERSDSFAMSAINEYLHAGYGVTIAIYPSSGLGHALTVWGYDYNDAYDEDDPRYYTHLRVTDSDDNRSDPNPVDVSYSPLDARWHLQGAYTGWYIGEVQALGQSPVPIPGAVWLFGSGLLVLIGLRRRLSHFMP